MTDTLSARVVFLLTLLGLVGCSLLATLHPPEAFDPERVTEQAGRNVAVRLDVATAHGTGDMLRGDAHPADGGATARIAWLWFRPPEPGPQPGDRITGQAQVSIDARGTALILDGPNTARIEPGPHPVAVHWNDLLGAPERLAGRLLLVNGHVDGDLLRAPDGASTCPLTGPLDDTARHAERHLLRLERETAMPGWSCRLEA